VKVQLSVSEPELKPKTCGPPAHLPRDKCRALSKGKSHHIVTPGQRKPAQVYSAQCT